uniref:Uncharacterized protein n=1 Tax=Candidatus Kentrum sp. FW TaxID=2126338 RepID=A0A450S4W9_9GAMM|nr:MAG: hypothetical protein BECKFW1821B_GA0114236_100184 [Candidatus Kentron sp. FW]VFJ48908.1 MAG: hypothetical protein BECKFW1821A_GA0114235_10218 [Candidatus Kentron sp. FW]VFJ66336.1 MAG: hypothetical protein BECKFW1821C_GA0114237_100937 [Candidatus Kentron sp. FW]
MKLASYTAIILILSWSVLTVVQLWGGALSPDLYWKITLTMVFLGGGVIVSSLIAREYLSEQRLRKDKFID